MKRYIVSKTDNREFYIVNYEWDEGDAESGPIIRSGQVVVKARNSRDAEQKVARRLGGVDCYATLARSEDIEAFISEMKESEYEYQTLVDAGIIDPDIDAQMNEDMDKDRFKRMSVSDLKDYYRKYVDGYFDSFQDWYQSLRSEGRR